MLVPEEKLAVTEIREKRQVTLPKDVMEDAGLHIHDHLAWSSENGVVHGKRMVPKEPRVIVAKLVKRGGRLCFDPGPGIVIDPDAIAEAVSEERKSR